MSTFQLEVVTPDRLVIQEEVESVIVPSKSGEMGIWAHHSPIISALEIGVVSFGPKHGKKRKLALGGGFLEMTDNKLTIMANTAELGEEIDFLRAQRAKERAEKRLADQQAEYDFHRARVALQKAISRIEAAENKRS